MLGEERDEDETIIELWEWARRKFGDDIAQESYAEMLAHGTRNEKAYFLGCCKHLKQRGYNDGIDKKKNSQGVRRSGEGLEEWDGIGRQTPEVTLLQREQLLSVAFVVAWALLNDMYVPRTIVRQVRGRAPGRR